MEQLLNLPESPPLFQAPNVVTVENTTDTDFETARSNIHGIIIKGQDALNDIITLARASDSPRAYEVVSQMIKTLIDANKDLIDLRKKLNDVQKDTKIESKTTNIENALFIGNTSELQKLINNRNNTTIVDDQ